MWRLSNQRFPGGPLPLSLESREVGTVTIIRCVGRIVAGAESESLRTHVAWLLEGVTFIDSSGLGTMVRALTSARQSHGDLKLCNVPGPIHKVLEMSRLTLVFESLESEEKAISAFYRIAAGAQKPASRGKTILCLDPNADVLAYLRELLRGAGYEVQSCARISDALLLMRVSRFDLLLAGHGLAAKTETTAAFQDALKKLPVVELEADFSTSHAGEAGAALLKTIDSRLA